MQKQQPQYLDNELTSKLQSKTKNTPILSQYLQEYQQKMANIELNDNQLMKLLQKHHIKYNTKKKFSQFSYFLKQNKFNYQALVLKIQIGYFQLQVNILNKQSSSPFKRFCKNTRSTHGIIYFLEIQNTQIAIKSIGYVPHQDQDQLQLFSKKFVLVLKQWTITRIASALQCAPQMHKPLGFDIVVYHDQILFAMEACRSQYTLTRTDLCGLKRQLAILHRFNIVHMDIKPANLMLSKSLKKMVFIDYGISSLIFESKGQKSLTEFTGTPNFVCKQMINLIYERTKSFIDLYYNDLYGLMICRSMFEKKMQYHDYLQQGLQSNRKNNNLSEQQKQQIQQGLTTINQEIQFQKFKFFYIKNDIAKIRQRLRQNFLNFKQKKIKSILQFIKKYSNVDFLKQLLQQLKDFKDNQFYKEIQMQFLACNEFLFKNIKTHIFLQNQEQQLNQNSFKIKYDQIFIESIQHYKISDFVQLYNKLLDKQYTKNLDKNILLAFFLKCLRFASKNLQIDKKIKLCVLLKIMDGQDLKEDYQGTFEDVKDIFKKLLRHYLSQPFTDDKKKLCLDCLYQNILIDNDITEELQEFQKILSKKYVGLEQRLTLSIQFRLINELLSCAVITEKNKHFKLDMIKFFKTKNKSLLSETLNIQFCKNSYEQDLKFLLKLLHKKYVFGDKDNTQNFKTLNDLISKVKHQKVKFKLQMFLIDLMLQSEKGILTNKIAMKIKKQFRQNNYEDGLPIYFAISFKFLYLQDILKDEYLYLIQSIRKNINYDPIYFQLNYNLCHDFSNYDVNDQQSLARYLHIIFLNIHIQGNYNDLIRSLRFQWVFRRIQANLKVRLSEEVKLILKNIILLLRQISHYMPQNHEPNKGITNLKQLNQTFTYIIQILQLQNRILQISPLQKIYLQQIQEEFNKQESHNISNSKCIFLKYYVRKLKLIYHYKRQKNQINQLNICLQLLQGLNYTVFQSLRPYYIILSLAMELSIRIKNQQIFSQLIGKLFEQIVVNKNIFDFICQDFFMPSSLCIYNMIDHYYRMREKDKTQQIFRAFFEWLSCNHLQSYGKIIITSLQFIQKYHKNIYRDQSFSKHIMKNPNNTDPYFILYYIFIIPYQENFEAKQIILLKIAVKIDQVVRLVKKFILNSYYNQFLKLKLFNIRKVRYLVCKQAKHYVAQQRKNNEYKLILGRIKRKMNKNQNYVFCKAIIDKLQVIAKINLTEENNYSHINQLQTTP